MKIIFTLLFLVFAMGSMAQHDKLPEGLQHGLQKSMDGMAASFKNLDLDGLLDYSHPNIFKVASREDIKAQLSEFMNSLTKEDIKEIKITGPLQLVKMGNEYQGVFEQFIHMMVLGKPYEGTTYLIGESFENGTVWKFFDYKKSKELAKAMLPGLSEKLDLPVDKNSE